MNFFDNFTSYVTDGSKRISARATVVVLGIALVLLLDNISGFSYYYNKQRQLDQLKSISELLRDTTLSTDTKGKLARLEQQTLDRKTFVDRSFSFLRKISGKNPKQTDNPKNMNSIGERNEFWFFFSASGLYVLALVLCVPVILLTDKKTPIFRLLAMLLIFFLTIAFTSWFNYWLFGVIIPEQLFGNWIWNYIVNFLLQIGFGACIYWAGKYKLRD